MPNRYVCSALEEVRTVLSLQAVKYETTLRDQSTLSLLIEEVQTYVNRMEASLGDKWDMHHIQVERCELNEEKRALRKEVKELTELRDSLLEEEDEYEEEEESQ